MPVALQYTKDMATEFYTAFVGEHKSSTSASWTGEISASPTVRFKGGEVDPGSVTQALDHIQKQGPEIRSRIVILMTHSQDAHAILEKAMELKFQPDT